MAVSKREPTLRAELVRKAFSQGAFLPRETLLETTSPSLNNYPYPPTGALQRRRIISLLSSKTPFGFRRTYPLLSQSSNSATWAGHSTLSHSLPARGTLPT